MHACFPYLYTPTCMYNVHAYAYNIYMSTHIHTYLHITYLTSYKRACMPTYLLMYTYNYIPAPMHIYIIYWPFACIHKAYISIIHTYPQFHIYLGLPICIKNMYIPIDIPMQTYRWKYIHYRPIHVHTMLLGVFSFSLFKPNADKSPFSSCPRSIPHLTRRWAVRWANWN